MVPKVMFSKKRKKLRFGSSQFDMVPKVARSEGYPNCRFGSSLFDMVPKEGDYKSDVLMS